MVAPNLFSFGIFACKSLVPLDVSVARHFLLESGSADGSFGCWGAWAPGSGQGIVSESQYGAASEPIEGE